MAINLTNALQVFNANGVDINEDFHALTSAQVDVVLACAKQDKYRNSAAASGSTARCYFEALQRQYRARNK